MAKRKTGDPNAYPYRLYGSTLNSLRGFDQLNKIHKQLENAKQALFGGWQRAKLK